MGALPFVSVIVPCYNEQATITMLLDAIYNQSYPRNRVEVVIADGLSTDSTLDMIASFMQSHPDLKIKLLENTKRNIPAGLNLAVGAAEGEIIVRVDAHAVPNREYIERSVADLENGKGENVGGVWEIQPGGTGWIARAIASATSHPVGVGDAYYRYGNQARLVDTVPFGAFRKSLLATLQRPSEIIEGPYDETLQTNEDYEFNVRVRQAGGRIWLDPTIRTSYFARSGLSDLARQYWRYGYWKQRMLARYPHTIRWRQALPPLFVFSLLGLAVLAIFLEVARWLLLAEFAVYAGILLVIGVDLAIRRRDAGLILGIPLAVGTMHIAWGSAFLWSLARWIVWDRRT